MELRLGDVPVPAADAAEQVEVHDGVLGPLLRVQRGDSLGDFLGDELLHVRLSVSGPWALGGLAPGAKQTVATRALGFAYLAKRAAGEEGQGEMTEPPPIGALRRFVRGSVALTNRAGGAPRRRREVLVGAVRRAVMLGFWWGWLAFLRLLRDSPDDARRLGQVGPRPGAQGRGEDSYADDERFLVAQPSQFLSPPSLTLCRKISLVQTRRLVPARTEGPS